MNNNQGNLLLRFIVSALIVSMSFLWGTSLFAQSNSFPATGNGFLYYLNYLKAGDRVFYQSPIHANTGYTRGIITAGIYFDGNNSNWQVNGGNYSDFGMLRFENSGSIGLFARENTGTSYTMTDTELENYRRFTILSNGNVGIGTRSPFSLFHVNGVASFRTANYTDGYVSINPGTSTTQGYINWWKPGNVRVAYMGHNDGASANNLALNLESSNFVINGGNVAIGTQDPKGYKLAVNGNIRAKEIKVEATNWPDYVFAKEYQLPSLAETEKHVKEKGHLPGIPSAQDVKENGIDLGEMNAKLLQKIEELTLHLIKMEKVNALREENHAKEIAELKSNIK